MEINTYYGAVGVKVMTFLLHWTIQYVKLFTILWLICYFKMFQGIYPIKLFNKPISWIGIIFIFPSSFEYS